MNNKIAKAGEYIHFSTIRIAQDGTREEHKAIMLIDFVLNEGLITYYGFKDESLKLSECVSRRWPGKKIRDLYWGSIQERENFELDDSAYYCFISIEAVLQVLSLKEMLWVKMNDELI